MHGGRPVLAGHSMGGLDRGRGDRDRLVRHGPEAVVMLDTAIARVQAGARWTWQADPLIFGHDRFPPDRLAAAGCPDDADPRVPLAAPGGPLPGRTTT